MTTRNHNVHGAAPKRLRRSQDNSLSYTTLKGSSLLTVAMKGLLLGEPARQVCKKALGELFDSQATVASRLLDLRDVYNVDSVSLVWLTASLREWQRSGKSLTIVFAAGPVYERSVKYLVAQGVRFVRFEITAPRERTLTL